MTAASPLPSAVSGRAMQAALLADGRRLHLNDGPIDLIIEASGEPRAVQAAFGRAAHRLSGLLDALCAELPSLRAPAGAEPLSFVHPVAQRMAEAVAPFAADIFITPMAAVAGAVAEHVLQALIGPGIDRAYVNNGGDIALHLPAGSSYTVGLVARPDRPQLVGTATLDAAGAARGIATSGWRGRSFSLGIADAVTVLAPSAAMADAAATVIANAVDLPNHPGIVREAACELQPDSDLGSLRVTHDVPDLSPSERAAALAAGLAVANNLVSRGLICDAALHLQGDSVSTGATHGLLLQSHLELVDA